MQGTKDYQEKLFLNFRLSEYVPKENFYRRLKETLDLSYLRGLTKKYYGSEGQKSIDTEVFFKLMLIGYLENINSDRQIVESARMRMDMLYFLGYDLDESLPWHSTLSRTRKLFGEDIFLELFRNILRLCVEKGMVNGKTQSVDSAFIKSNASMESLVEKELQDNSKKYLTALTENEDGCVEGKRKIKIKSDDKHSERFVSTTDPDARVSYKRGKQQTLNHLGVIRVDSQNHVICGAMVEFADKRDSETTKRIVDQTIENLQESDIKIEEVLADTNYSSGDSYRYLESRNITAYIPVHGSYLPERKGFIYDKEKDCYVCSEGKLLPYKKITERKYDNRLTKVYRADFSTCQTCPQKNQCCKTSKYKTIEESISKSYYDTAFQRMNTAKGKQKMRVRRTTVEPVWGTLLDYRAMRKVYTKGNELAHKQLLMAAAAYNLKKLLCVKPLKYVLGAIKRSAINIKNSIWSDIQIFVKANFRIYFHKPYLQIKLCYIR